MKAYSFFTESRQIFFASKFINRKEVLLTKIKRAVSSINMPPLDKKHSYQWDTIARVTPNKELNETLKCLVAYANRCKKDRKKGGDNNDLA